MASRRLTALHEKTPLREPTQGSARQRFIAIFMVTILLVATLATLLTLLAE